jgi:hypothetical protein
MTPSWIGNVARGQKVSNQDTIEITGICKTIPFTAASKNWSEFNEESAIWTKGCDASSEAEILAEKRDQSIPEVNTANQE